MIYILTGDIKTGKSAALMQWTQDRTDVFGVISPTDVINGRYFLNARTRASFQMEAKDGDKEIISVGPFQFLVAAFKNASFIIKNAIENTKNGFIIIDEIGKLEMQSKGLHEAACVAIDATRHNTELHVLLVVRTSLYDSIIKKYNIIHPILLTKEQLIALNL